MSETPKSTPGQDRLARMQKTVKVHQAMEAKKTLQVVEDEFPDNPEGMKYFYERLHAYTEGKSLVPDGKKIVGTLCIHVPDELIYAAGAVPVRLCSGAYASDQVGAEFMPAKSCPLIKSTLGKIYLDMVPDAVMIVNPTTCDQKRKFGEISGEFSDRFYTLEVPPTKDSEEAREYWQRVVKRFAKALEKATGTKITRKGMKAAINRVRAAQAQYRRFHNLRKHPEPLIRGKDAFIVANTYFFDDIDQWTQSMDLLNTELECRLASGKSVGKPNSPRIIMSGSPSIFPNMKMPLLVEQLGAVIVADETCSSNRLLYDMVAADEGYLYDMVPAVADRYLKPCTCPNFTPNTDRERKLVEMAKTFAADGVIYQAFSGCQLYEMESRRIGKVLESSGIPMLYLETDYSPDDTGQLSTRIEAFLESIKVRKRKGSA